MPPGPPRRRRLPRPAAADASTASHARLTGSHDDRTGTGGSVIRYSGEPGPASRRPNTALAYYLGRPASVWITAMRPRRRDTASNHLIQAGARHIRGGPTFGLVMMAVWL